MCITLVNRFKNLDIILLFSICLLSNCGPDPAPTPIDMSCAGRLEANDLVGLKPCLEGNWKIAYSKNQSGQKQLLANSFVRITSDSVFYFSEGDIIAESPIMLMPDPSPTISFTNWRDENFNWKIQGISDDTIFLADGNKRFAIAPSELHPTIICEGYLREKALNQIRPCILGKWQFYSYGGGYSGHDKYYYTSEHILHFRASDSLDYIADGVYLWRAKLKWEKIKKAYGDVWYQFTAIDENGVPVRDHRISQLKQDTLSLDDDNPDSYGYTLVRKQ